MRIVIGAFSALLMLAGVFVAFFMQDGGKKLGEWPLLSSANPYGAWPNVEVRLDPAMNPATIYLTAGVAYRPPSRWSADFLVTTYLDRKEVRRQTAALRVEDESVGFKNLGTSLPLDVKAAGTYVIAVNNPFGRGWNSSRPQWVNLEIRTNVPPLNRKKLWIGAGLFVIGMVLGFLAGPPPRSA